AAMARCWSRIISSSGLRGYGWGMCSCWSDALRMPRVRRRLAMTFLSRSRRRPRSGSRTRGRTWPRNTPAGAAHRAAHGAAPMSHPRYTGAALWAAPAGQADAVHEVHEPRVRAHRIKDRVHIQIREPAAPFIEGAFHPGECAVPILEAEMDGGEGHRRHVVVARARFQLS